MHCLQVKLGNDHPLTPEDYPYEWCDSQITAEIGLTLGVVKQAEYLLAGKAKAAGLAETLHHDLRLARVLYAGLSELYWTTGQPSLCHPSWLAFHHPEAAAPDTAADPNAPAQPGRKLPTTPRSKQRSQNAARWIELQEKESRIASWRLRVILSPSAMLRMHISIVERRLLYVFPSMSVCLKSFQIQMVAMIHRGVHS